MNSEEKMMIILPPLGCKHTQDNGNNGSNFPSISLRAVRLTFHCLESDCVIQVDSPTSMAHQ